VGSGRRGGAGQGLVDPEVEETPANGEMEDEEEEEDENEDFEWRCTKCRKDDFAELAEFHSHIFECALK